LFKREDNTLVQSKLFYDFRYLHVSHVTPPHCDQVLSLRISGSPAFTVTHPYP
jgi:hypothetical protein